MTRTHKIASIIGARPQFIKHAVMEPWLKKHFRHLSIHSGQHYDEDMSRVFFDELNIDPPTYQLKTNESLHGKQTASVLIDIEEILIKEMPEMVIVYGDTNTTLAGALAASKLHIPIAHIEAGMRSFNKAMPEEVNRIVTDHLSALLFTPSKQSTEQLKSEGITDGVFYFGDIMKDLTLLMKKKGLIKKVKDNADRIYCTIHRPYNTDDHKRLDYILNQLNQLDKKVVFSLHPRTSKMMSQNKLNKQSYSNIEFIKPQSYLNNLNFLYNSAALITDSGGMQKEAYFLQKRCITLRSETEWTETLENNWNTLVFNDLSEMKSLLEQAPGVWDHELYGDGMAGQKIANEIKSYLKREKFKVKRKKFKKVNVKGI